MKHFIGGMQQELAGLVRRKHSPATCLFAYAAGAAFAGPAPEWLGWAIMVAVVASVLMTID